MQTHPWLEKYPINRDSKYLILGTHPPMPYGKNNVQFYYCNMNEFWKLISSIYPNDILFPNNQYSIENIKAFLNNYSFSITDMVFKTKKNNFSTDSQMQVVSLNPFLKDWIASSKVEIIYFTSFNSQRNSTLSLFKRWLKEEKLPHDPIPDAKLWMENGLNINICNRPFKLVALYSPSPSARRGIPKSFAYKKCLNENQFNANSTDEFRIFWYKKHFPTTN
jgi:hypothetical protein